MGVLTRSGFSFGFSQGLGGTAPIVIVVLDRLEWLLFRHPHINNRIKKGNRYILRTREKNFPDDPDAGSLPDCLLTYLGQAPNNLLTNTNWRPVLNYSVEIRTDTFNIRDAINLGDWAQEAWASTSYGGPRLGDSGNVIMAALGPQSLSIDEDAKRWSVRQEISVTVNLNRNA